VLVVFLRGVNVGRHKRFLPAQLARDLAAFDVANVGAAGTFVVRVAIAQTTLLAEIRKRLAFDAGIIIVQGAQLVAFARSEPFGRHAPAPNEQRFATIMLKRLRKAPDLPLMAPSNDKWQVKVVAVAGQLVASVWRHEPAMQRPLYPNAVIEKQFGMATTRNWNTINTIGKILSESARTGSR
jgi:uncharacterized protein (DUF1697 family)